MRVFTLCRLTFIGLIFFTYQATLAAYKGSHAYNHAKAFKIQVNTATGTLSLNYPLIEAQGVRMPLKVNLTYSFNAHGMFGLPSGWQLDLDHITQHTAELGGMQLLIDDLWHDETGFASGLKYYNQHGTQFRDEGQTLPIPGYPNLNYRHVTHRKDGSRQFFSNQGLLVLLVDRFDNHVHFNYEKPVVNLESAKLASIKDDYGNVYRFSYEPGTMIIKGPDNRVQRVYFNGEGVTRVDNPLQQSYKITYINKFGRNLMRTLETPEGLITEVSYDAIFYTDDSGKKQMPVVNHFIKYDQADLKTHHEVYYKFSEDNNYTGYPIYALLNNGDSLVDSNDQSYKYSVEVKHINGEQQSQMVYEYNYLHLPVEVRTLRQGKPYLKTTFEYAISPFKYSRSTNYDKPTEAIRYVWNGRAYIPSDKTANTYDHYGNKLSQTRSVYDRQSKQWKGLDATVSRYYTDHYSLLAEHTRVDLLGGRAIRKSYALAPDGKTHSYERLAWKTPFKEWQDWQQTDLTHDEKGRRRSATRRWLIKNRPGVQSVSHHTHYQFDPATAELTITKVSDQGREHKMIVDTRNARHLKTITPKGEVATYTYDALNRPLTQTDPAGHVIRHTYETFSTDGKNTVTTQSPLGNTRRTIHDASKRAIRQQDLHKGQWRTLSSQTYNAYGKVDSKTDILGLTSTVGYDELSRHTSTTDPWGNEHRIEYNDPAMTTTTRINGRRHQEVSKVPWERKLITRHYPVTNNPHDQATEFVESTVIHDTHKKAIRMTSALVDLYTQKERQMITNHLRYDANHNLIASETHTWDGLHGQKNREYDLLNNLYTWHKTLKTPEHTSSHTGYRYLYDSDGLLAQVESPKKPDGSRLYLKHRYDKNGREIKKIMQNGHSIHYQYDNRGLLTEHSWSRNQKRHAIRRQYDADGRLVKLSDSHGQTMDYRYTPSGHLLGIRYPDNRSLSFILDNYDRVITQKDANQTEQHFIYKPQDKGHLSSIKVNNSRIDFHYGEDDNGHRGQLIKRTNTAETTGVTETDFRYGVFGQVVESVSGNSKGHYGVSYNYSTRGELFKQVQKLAEKGQLPQYHTTEYRYDGMLRLIDEVHTDQATSLQKRYRYDGNNNLLAEEDHSHCGPGQSVKYSYNNLDQLVNVKVGEVIKPVLHDANGHLTQDHKATQYKYDDAGFLLQVQPQQRPAIHYGYWPNGLLSRRSSDGSERHFYPDHHKNMQTVVKDGQWRSLVRHGNSIVGRQTNQGFDQFFKVNESTGVVLQQAKGETQLSLHRYDAYGKPLQRNQTDDTDFTWNQELTELETGLTYLRHRFHHPELRRFITRDNVHIDNRYAYAHGDPVNYADPTGHTSVFKYVFGGLMIAAGIIGAYLTLPSFGATLAPSGAAVAAGASAITESVSFAAVVEASLPTVAGVFTALSGASLVGSQLALDLGSKGIYKDLTIASIAFGVVAAADLVALSPKIVKGIRSILELLNKKLTEVFQESASYVRVAAGESEASSTSNGAIETERGEYLYTHKGEDFFLNQPKGYNDAMGELNKKMDSEFDGYNDAQKKCLYDVCKSFLGGTKHTPVQVRSNLSTYDALGKFTPNELYRMADRPQYFDFTSLNVQGETFSEGIYKYVDSLKHLHF